jgi:tetratricopeptide (TPR) repeat protein
MADVLGKEHPGAAAALVGKANLLRQDDTDAMGLYQRALALQLSAAAGPKGHEVREDVSTTRYNMAQLLAEQGRLAEAEAQFRFCSEELRAALGATHPEAARADMGLAALLHHRLDRTVEAADLCQRALPVLRSTFGGEHEEVASASLLAAKIFSAAGERYSAEAAGAAAQAAAAFEAIGRVKEASAARDLQAKLQNSVAAACAGPRGPRLPPEHRKPADGRDQRQLAAERGGAAPVGATGLQRVLQ